MTKQTFEEAMAEAKKNYVPITQKTLKELVKSLEWSKVRKEMLRLYPNQSKCLPGYKKVFDKLQKIVPKKSKNEIEITYTKDREDKKPYAGVHGLEKDEECKKCHANTNTVCMMFAPWREWAGMKTTLNTAWGFSDVEVVVHCLWEMTFCGFNEEKIQKEADELQKRAKEVMKNPEKYTKKIDIV